MPHINKTLSNITKVKNLAKHIHSSRDLTLSEKEDLLEDIHDKMEELAKKLVKRMNK